MASKVFLLTMVLFVSLCKPDSIIQQNFKFTNNGFKWNYETEDGIKVEQEGEYLSSALTSGAILNQGRSILKKEPTSELYNKVRGSFSYVGDDNKVYKVTYYADESGFHAEGDHIPKGVRIEFDEKSKSVGYKSVSTSVPELNLELVPPNF